ncbi:hypothetical protein SBC1_14670 [Caballeronia sp. SBC1]|nr:hypothetical protein SBC2_16070 [Caballeronia sp. SBC2]QIN61475.1 hypothetical protein SBC1_14670 [Caballeronia sp. SBC1]
MGATLTRRGLGFKAVDMENCYLGRKVPFRACLFGHGILNFTVTGKKPIGRPSEGGRASRTSQQRQGNVPYGVPSLVYFRACPLTCAPALRCRLNRSATPSNPTAPTIKNATLKSAGTTV